MCILVTGGSGMVGAALKEIKKDWIYLSSKDGDLRNFEECKKIFEKYKPTGVVHLAANVGGLYKNLNNKIEMFEDNLYINLNIMKCCNLYDVTKFLGCLSTCIFPDGKILKDIHDGAPHYSNEGYAYAKRMLDIHCKLYREKGYQYYNIIPTNIYGPYDNFNLETGHLIASLIHKCYLAKQNNIPFKIKGSGKAYRQFIYSKDLAHYIAILMLRCDKNHIIAHPKEYKIVDVVNIIADLMNYHYIEYEHLNYNESYDGQYRKTVVPTKEGVTSLNIGIKNTIDFFIKNKEMHVRK